MNSKFIGQRLTKLNKMISNGYTHIWDCCCDHGLLGLTLATRQAAPYIHFVDVVPELVEKVQDKLMENAFTNVHCKTYCIDATLIPLHKHTGHQLIIIAGVGGDLTRQIVSHIHDAHLHAKVDFLLCPIRQHYTLRRHLKEKDFVVKQEALVEENKRIYEVMLVTSRTNAQQDDSTVSPTGEQIWKANDPIEFNISSRYHEQLLTHYGRMLANNDPQVAEIIQDYKKVKPTLM